MRLTFWAQSQSIKDFEAVELPALAIVTGPNGVGKTHLLRAINEGRIRAEIEGVANVSSIYIDAAALMPRNAERVASASLESERTRALVALDMFKTHSRQPHSTFRGALAGQGISLDDFKENDDALRAALDKIKLIEQAQARSHMEFMLNNSAQQVSNLMPPNHQPDASFEMLREVSARFGKPIALLRVHEVSDFLSKVETDLIGHSFSRLFLQYHHRFMANKYQEFLAQQKVEGANPLTGDEFIERYGEPPWDVVNGVLAGFNGDLRISKPEGVEIVSFQAEVTQLSTGATYPFGSLSSGQSIFFSLFLAMLKSVDDRQKAEPPSLVLLDEVEAPLHPTMVKEFLSAVRKVFVEKLGCHVVMTTHSPTTVALASEDAIYIMTSRQRG